MRKSEQLKHGGGERGDWSERYEVGEGFAKCNPESYTILLIIIFTNSLHTQLSIWYKLKFIF